MLEAMRDPCFSLWRVQRRHETAGRILPDLLRGGEAKLVDETMEKTARTGLESRTCPETGRLRHDGSDRCTGRPESDGRGLHQGARLEARPGDVLAGNPRFAIAICRAAVAIGVMDAVCQSALNSFQVTASKSFQFVRLILAVFAAA